MDCNLSPMRPPRYNRPAPSAQAMQRLAHCAHVHAVAQTRPMSPYRGLDRLLQQYRPSVVDHDHCPALSSQELLALWHLLAWADTWAALSTQIQAGHLCRRWALAIGRVLRQTVPALSIDQRRLLCEWITHQPEVEVAAHAVRAEQILAVPIYAFQVELPQPAVVAPPSLSPASAAEYAFACGLSDLGVRYYTAPVCAQSLDRLGPALYPGYAPGEPAPWPARRAPPSAGRA